MPELPEVETTKKALLPHVCNRQILGVWAKADKLREPILPDQLAQLQNLTFTDIVRLGKHLIFQTHLPEKALHAHLGMTGAFRIENHGAPLSRHDYLSILLDNATELRYADPRKFGLLALINPQNPPKTIAELGLEPLDYSVEALANHLFQNSRKTRTAIKTYIMNQKIVVGVGNIYASEALFTCKISPLRPANQVTQNEYFQLAKEIQRVLQLAILAGGTTIKDFQAPDGSAGYFFRELQIYGRKVCPNCQNLTTSVQITGRTSTYCPICQH